MLNDVSATSTNDGAAKVLDVPITVDCAEIDIEKTAADATVDPGDNVTYTITVTNNGDGEARDVVVTDTLPTNPGLDWTVTVSPEGAGTCDTDSVPMTCDLGTIAGGDTVTITLTSPTTAAICAGDNTIENTVSVTTSNDGRNTSDADVEAEGNQPTVITVDCAEIDIEKTAADATVDAGDNVTYTITVTNNGDGEARDVVVTDTLPTNPGLDWTVTVSPEGAGTCDTDSVPMTCDLGTIAGGDTVTITLTSPTTAAICAGDNTIENTASVTTSNDGRDTSDADVEAEGNQPTVITVDCAEIDIEKTAADATVDTGDNVTYTITVTNNGDGEARDVVVTDTLPTNPGLDWTVTVSPEGAGTCDTDSVPMTCDLGTIAGGDTVTIALTSPTTAAICAGDNTIENTASVTTSNDGRDTSDADVEAEGNQPTVITVDCAEIDIEKTAADATVDACDNVTYTITVTNNGDGRARDVVVTDTLPTNPGLDWTVTVSPEGAGTCDTDSVPMTCDLGTIAGGDTVTITLTSPTTAAICAGDNTIENTPSVTTSNDGRDTSDADVEAEGNQPTVITVDCAEIDIEKTAADATVDAGDNVTYTITVTNNGDGEARDVVVTDTLPPTRAWTGPSRSAPRAQAPATPTRCP